MHPSSGHKVLRELCFNPTRTLLIELGLFFDRCFAIVRTEMRSPSARANYVIMVRCIKPGTEIVCPWHGIRIMASAVVNDNPSRWHYCRDIRNIFHFALGHHG